MLPNRIFDRREALGPHDHRMERLLRAELKNAELARAYDRIYEESLKIWEEQHLKQFTSHGPAHTEQVEKNLYDLTRPLHHAGCPLSDEELYILLSATCLHDIGMQLSDDPEVRRKHAQNAYELILNSSAHIGPELRRVTLPIYDTIERLAIAKLARAHWTDHALQLPSVDFINQRRVEGRLKLLGLLLAMADLLDLSPVRARYFRTIHRLYDLPPESQLHQTTHELVYGTRIRPPNGKIPGMLQFEVEWVDDSEIMTVISDWVVQWFNSQWRQIQPALFHESGGAIHWTNPWVKVSFRPPEGPIPELKPEARNVLMAERFDQIRVDRNAFASRFLEALKNKESVVFVLPGDPNGDWPILSNWSLAYARLHDNCRTAEVDVGLTPYLPGIVTDILDQWKHPLSSHPDEQLEGFLAGGPSLVTIVKTLDAYSEPVETLLKTLVLPSSSAARICLLICPNARGPKEMDHTTIINFDSSPLPVDEIEEHLQKRHGCGPEESRRLCDEMRTLKLTDNPDQVYTYIELNCSHNSRR
jgi:hypothetical protein